MARKWEGKTGDEIDAEITMRTAEADYKQAQGEERVRSAEMAKAREKLEAAQDATAKAFDKYRAAVQAVIEATRAKGA